MRKIMYGTGIIYLFLLWASCDTFRQKIQRKENSHVQYAKMASNSDSIFRSWYFSADSAFSYHPDSGLRTLSGRMLGWELRINHSREQHALDSSSSLQHNEMEATQETSSIWMWWYTVLLVLAAIFIILFFMVNRK